MSLNVLIPLLNPNDPEAVLAEIMIEEGQYVNEGDVLCTLETTKSTNEITAESSGYIKGLFWKAGNLVKAGDLFCYISQKPDWNPPSPEKASTDEDLKSPFPSDLRITKPALNYANSKNYDLSKLPIGPLITKNTLIDYFEKQDATNDNLQVNSKLDPTLIVIYGGGGHGKSVIDLIRTSSTFQLMGVIDDSLVVGTNILNVPVIGGHSELGSLKNKGVFQVINAIGGIGNITTRVKIFNRIHEAGLLCPTIKHSSAVIEPSAIIGSGVQIFSHAYIGSDSQIGFGVIINTSSVVSHECVIHDFVNISPGTLIAGDVEIGIGSLVGMGVTINLGVRIGKNVKIGNGATVKDHIPDNTIIQAGKVWP